MVRKNCAVCTHRAQRCRGTPGKPCDYCAQHKIVCLIPFLKELPIRSRSGTALKRKTKIDDALHGKSSQEQSGIVTYHNQTQGTSKMDQIVNRLWMSVGPLQGLPLPKYTNNPRLISIGPIYNFCELDKTNFLVNRECAVSEIDPERTRKELANGDLTIQYRYATNRFRLPSNDLLDGLHKMIAELTNQVSYMAPDSLLAFGILVQELIYDQHPASFGILTIEQIEALAPNLVDLLGTEIQHHPLPDWIQN